MKIKNILIILIATLLSSCSTVLNTPLRYNSIGDKCYLDVEIFQALSSHEALAQNIGNDYDNNSIIIKLITIDDVFFDGKRLRGQYIMVDTYTYESKEETVKTVPVYIKVSESEKYDLKSQHFNTNKNPLSNIRENDSAASMKKNIKKM